MFPLQFPAHSLPRVGLSWLPAFLVLLTACGGGREATDTQTFHAMDSDFQISLPAASSSGDMASAIQISGTIMADLHKRLGTKVQNSEMALVNRAGHTLRLPISRDTYNVLLLAQEYAKRTGGAFDITTAPIAGLWGFDGAPLPDQPHSPAVLRAALAGVGSAQIRLQSNAVELLSPLTRLDTEDLVRAYAMDRCLIRLKRNNFGDILLQYPGLACAQGAAGNNRPWTFPVAHPFDPAAKLGELRLDLWPAVCVVRHDDETIVIQGRAYSRVMDPRTGMPADSTTMALAAAPTATEALALAHALFVLGPDGASALRIEFDRCEFLLVPRREPAQVLITSGLAEAFTFSPDLDIPSRIMD